MATIEILPSQIIEIARNVTGRVDSSDPLFSNVIMLQRLNQFVALQAPEDIRIFQNFSWWEFTLTTTSEDPYPVNLKNLNGDNTLTASTIGPPAYADGFDIWWYQNPGEFYAIWPETQTYQPQRPTYVLYYNNELTFRGPPDRDYAIKIGVYKTELEFAEGTAINTPYLYRYLAYGMSLDIFSDYGEMDRYNEIYPVFSRYRALVYARTWNQFIPTRTIPQF